MNGKRAIFVLSRPAIEAAKAHDEPHVIISINCPGDEPARIPTNRATLGRLNLFFWDLDHKPTSGIVEYNGFQIPIDQVPDEQLMQPEHARQIVDFVEAHMTEAEDFLVHCTAGKSRSAAVAATLYKILFGNDDSIFKNPRFTPNMRVYRMILDEWYSRHPMETNDGDGDS